MQLCGSPIILAAFVAFQLAAGQNLTSDPNYALIKKAFPNTSDQVLLNIRSKLQSLSSKVQSSSVPLSSATINAPMRPKWDANPPAGAPKSFHEINKLILPFLYQGDIRLTEQQISDRLSTSSRKKRKATSNSALKWPTKSTGYIPYFIDPAFSVVPDTVAVIRAAVKFWENNACVRFVENGTGPNSINFFYGSGCWSYIGMQGGPQQISIGYRCEFFGIVTHEIGHALGFYHEQSRYDRDSYVSINSANVIASLLSNFNKETPATMNLYNVSYDYGSVMHYASEDFAIDTTIPTIIALDPRFQQTMGNRRAPSFLDILTMNRLYGCAAFCTSSTTVCKNGGYPNPNNCAQCICPATFGGALCDILAPGQNGVCGATYAATTVWQSFTATVGTNNLYNTTTCSWQITSPPGTQIQVQFLSITGGYCYPGCFYNSIDIVLDTVYTKSGIRHCCPADILTTPYLSTANLVPILAYANGVTMTFTIKYRYVAASSTTTTPSPPTTPSPTVTPSPGACTATPTTTTPTTPPSSCTLSTASPTTSPKPPTTPPTATTTTVTPQACPAGYVWYPPTNYCIGQCYTSNVVSAGFNFTASFTAQSAWQTSGCVTIPLNWYSGCYIPITGPVGTQVQVNIANIIPGVCSAGCPITALSVSDNLQAPSAPICCSTDAPKLFTMTSNRALVIVKATSAPYTFDFAYRYVTSTSTQPTTLPPVTSLTTTTMAPQACPAGYVWYPVTNYCIGQCYTSNVVSGSFNFTASFTSQSTWQSTGCITIPLNWYSGCYVPITSPAGTQVQVSIDSIIPGVCSAGCPITALSVSDNLQPPSPAYCCSTDAPKLFTMTTNKALVIMKTTSQMFTFGFSYRYISGTG